jgi:hypothetical protein
MIELLVSNFSSCLLYYWWHSYYRYIHRLPTTAVRVRARVQSCGICGGQSGIGADFPRVFRFPLPILILPTAPQSSSMIWGRYNTLNIGRSTKWTQSQLMRQLKMTIIMKELLKLQ